jgi:hypothetical protein
MPVYREEHADRPGAVTEIRGIVFQNDGQSTVGRLFIRPLEAIDRWVAGILPDVGDPPLAMHAGIHVLIDGSREYVAEQLVGSLYLDFRNGLNWTPFDKFRQRDRGGWDVTVPAACFRSVDAAAVAEATTRLNTIEGHPFVGEDCTAFIERSFRGQRLFADSPLLRLLGFAARVGDPAMPLLKPASNLDTASKTKLQFEKIKRLPDAVADVDSPNVQLWAHRLVPAAAFGAVLGRIAYSSASRRSMPASSTARRFFR